MRFTSQHKAINQKEYGKAVSPLRYDSLALILSWSIFVVYGKQSEKNKYICSSKRHSALHTFWDTTDAYLYIAKFLFPQQIYCINLKGTVSASSLFSSRQLATCSSRPPKGGGGVRSRASSTPNCILEWKIR